MAAVDDEVKAYFAKYSTEAEPSEHFPLMELPAYDCEKKLTTAEVFYQSEKGYDDNDAIQLGKAIVALKPPGLRQIYLSKNSVGDAGAIGLAAGLKELEEMDTLHFADNQIGDAGMVALADSIKHLGCTTLVFTRNTFGDEGAEAFAKALADPDNFANLEWLFLNECQIGDKGAVAIAKALLTGAKELVRLALHDKNRRRGRARDRRGAQQGRARAEWRVLLLPGQPAHRQGQGGRRQGVPWQDPRAPWLAASARRARAGGLGPLEDSRSQPRNSRASRQRVERGTAALVDEVPARRPLWSTDVCGFAGLFSLVPS